ncbi:hypothetical protein O181_102808 [Austropuccinia psidii MF-1]|uniref:Uncharacterized protein n=1 Tax=Austropuccinia psidii MF-1 TaxID=1389203 RepID=A0A9Q3JH12_9BASI|nr:hypothetical protein [Austropuccinia psidii MF-1]
MHQSPGQISCQSSAIDFTSHRASRQRQSAHVSGFSCLRAPTALQMRLQHCPPSLSSPLLYAFTPLPLPSLRARGALPTCLRHHQPSLHLSSALLTCSQHCLPSLRLRSALPTCSQHHLSLRLCSALPTLLTILKLAECPPNMLRTPVILTLV